MVTLSKQASISVKMFVAVLFFLSMFWWYPNIVHEQLHAITAKIQGVPVKIQYDWSFPAQPTTTKLPVRKHMSVVGALAFALMPSVFDILILLGAFMTRKRAAIITHIMVPTYCAIELLLNIGNYKAPFSDFAFLRILPDWVNIAIFFGVITVIAWWASKILGETSLFKNYLTEETQT